MLELLIMIVLVFVGGCGCLLLLMYLGYKLIMALPVPASVPEPESKEPKDLSRYRYTPWGDKVKTHDKNGDYIRSSELGLEYRDPETGRVTRYQL